MDGCLVWFDLPTVKLPICLCSSFLVSAEVSFAAAAGAVEVSLAAAGVALEPAVGLWAPTRAVSVVAVVFAVAASIGALAPSPAIPYFGLVEFILIIF